MMSMYGIRLTPTKKELKEQRIATLKSWAIFSGTRDFKRIMNQDIITYHVSDGTARNNTKIVVHQLCELDSLGRAIQGALNWFRKG